VCISVVLVNQVARQANNTLKMKVLCADQTAPTADDSDGEKLSDVHRNGSGLSCDVDVTRYFYLKNTGTRDLVMDVTAVNRLGVTPVILWDQKYGTNHHAAMLLSQLWYEDTATSTIRTALNDFCLDVYSKSCGLCNLFFTTRRFAKRGICRHRVFVCVCVCHTPVLYPNG